MRRRTILLVVSLVGALALVQADVDKRLADHQHLSVSVCSGRQRLPQLSKSTDEYARSLDNRCSLEIRRIVPLRERITSESVVHPPAR